MMNQIINKLKGLVVRGVIKSINDTGARQMVVATLLAGEVKDRIERIQQFGMSSHPPSGAAAVFAAVAADRSRLVCIGENHPTHRPTDLVAGETQIYDAFEQFIHLQQSGVIYINAAGELRIVAPTKVRIETPQLEVTGEIIDKVDSSGQSMSGMRATYNTHTHPENDGGGPTNVPIQTMGG